MVEALAKGEVAPLKVVANLEVVEKVEEVEEEASIVKSNN